MKCAAMNKYLNPSTCTCMFNAEKEKSVGNIPSETLFSYQTLHAFI